MRLSLKRICKWAILMWRQGGASRVGLVLGFVAILGAIAYEVGKDGFLILVIGIGVGVFGDRNWINDPETVRWPKLPRPTVRPTETPENRDSVRRPPQSQPGQPSADPDPQAEE